MNDYPFPHGFEVTLYSGILFMPSFGDFQAECEKLLGEPLTTLAFLSDSLIEQLKEAVENTLMEYYKERNA